MCGIGGVFCKNFSKENLLKYLNNINNLQKHRGPDNSKIWIDKDLNFGLCHSRLSIIDIDNSADQPFETKNHVIIFNGEIYNFKYLQDYLKKRGHIFRTNSDTEVLLNSYLEWGAKCLEKISGMFSFVIFDKFSKDLFAARDAVGQKPFFYLNRDQLFVFASEINSIKSLNYHFIKEIDYNSISSFFTKNFRNISSPKTAYKYINRLRPGHYFITNLKSDKKIRELPFLKSESGDNFDPNEIIESISESSISDVGFSTLLSGGIDSRLIALILKKEKNLNFDTYTIGLDENDPDIKNAKAFANSIGINNKSIYFNFEGSFNRYKNLIKCNGEPFSLIPSLLYFDLFKNISSDGYKVVLSGNGADEIFMGYNDIFKTVLINYFTNFFFRNKGGKKSNHEKYNFKNNSLKAMIIDRDKNIKNLFNDYNNNYLSDEASYWCSILNPTNYINEHYLIQLLMTHQHSLTLSSDLSGMLNSLEVRSPFLEPIIIKNFLLLNWKKKIEYKNIFNFNPKNILKNLFLNLCKKHNLSNYLFQEKRGIGYELQEDKIFKNYWTNEMDLIFENFNDLNNFFNKKHVIELYKKFKKGNYKNTEIISKLLSTQLWIQDL